MRSVLPILLHLLIGRCGGGGRHRGGGEVAGGRADCGRAGDWDVVGCGGGWRGRLGGPCSSGIGVGDDHIWNQW